MILWRRGKHSCGLDAHSVHVCVCMSVGVCVCVCVCGVVWFSEVPDAVSFGLINRLINGLFTTISDRSKQMKN